MNCGVGMRQEPRRVERKGLSSTGSDLDRRYWIALALYAVLAALAWFTVGDSEILIHGRPVELRLLPLIIIGGMALRTVLARHAEKIRRGGNGGGGSTPKSL